MKKVLSAITFLLLFVLSSCGRDQKIDRSIASIETGSILPLQSIMDDAQRVIALEICRAYRTKRLRIQGRMYDGDPATQEPISIRVTKGECSSKKEDDKQTVKSASFIPSVDAKGVPRFSYHSGEGSSLFSTDIETDEAGHLSGICNNLLDDEIKTDPVVIEYPNKNEVKMIRFEEPNIFFLAYGEKITTEDDLSEPEYRLIQKTQLSVYLDQEKKYYGFIDKIEKETGCLKDHFSKTVQNISLPSTDIK